MAIPDIYTDGTISVTNGSTTVIGQGTAFSTRVRRGAILAVGNSFGIIASNPDSDDEDDFPEDLTFELVEEWAGSSAVESNYVILNFRSGADIAESFSELIELLVGKGLGLVTSGPPITSEGRNNDFRFDQQANVLYFKIAGAWVAFTSDFAFDAYGAIEDREDYEDEDAGFKFFDSDNEVWYVLESGSPASWAGPFEFRGPQGGDRYDINFNAIGKPLSGEILPGFLFTTEVTFESGLLSSRAVVTVAPTATSVFSIQKNGVEFGTCTFSIGATEGVFVASTETSFEAGDVIGVVCPDPSDATLKGLNLTVTGSR